MAEKNISGPAPKRSRRRQDDQDGNVNTSMQSSTAESHSAKAKAAPEPLPFLFGFDYGTRTFSVKYRLIDGRSPSPSPPPPPEPSSYEIARSREEYFARRSRNFTNSTINSKNRPPINLLEDLATTHHLLSLDLTEHQVIAEHAAIETFCSVVWSERMWQACITAARAFGRPHLSTKDKTDATTLPHGWDCVYRNRALELLEDVVERMKLVDSELACVLESCSGDWMVRFRKHEAV